MIHGATCGVKYIVVGNGHGDQSLKSWMRLLAFYIALGKGMNPTVFPPAMGKILGQTGLFNLSVATSLEGKLSIQTPHKK